MPRYIAFLRAVNVGGRTIKMAQLKSIFESMGFSAVETFIASGNVIFSTKSTSSANIERKIEDTLKAELGYDVPVFIRTDAQLAQLSTRELFSKAEQSKAHGLYVGFLGQPLATAGAKALKAANTETELFRTDDREIHFLALISMADSKFSITKLEKQLGCSTTFRNINTVARLTKKYPPK